MTEPTDHDSTTPITEREESPDRQLAFLEELLDEHATVAGDVIELDAHTWAIHGFVAVDGDVLLAEYATEDEARSALGELSKAERLIQGSGPSAPAPLNDVFRVDEGGFGWLGEGLTGPADTIFDP